MPYPKIIHTHIDACTGCKTCEMVCSLIHEKTGINPRNSRIKIRENTAKGIYIPVVCQLCEDIPCVAACPESALSQHEITGAIVVDEANCSACGLCVDACVHEAIFIHPEINVACVCDLCGGKPKCVEYCLQDALLFERQKKYDSGHKIKT